MKRQSLVAGPQLRCKRYCQSTHHEVFCKGFKKEEKGGNGGKEKALKKEVTYADRALAELGGLD